MAAGESDHMNSSTVTAIAQKGASTLVRKDSEGGWQLDSNGFTHLNNQLFLLHNN